MVATSWTGPAAGAAGTATAIPARPATPRDGFLDTIRAVSILRVVVWHAFGAAVITYVVSAVPAMFFVTGSLLAHSIDAKGARTTVHDRLRRLLVPFWAFGAVAVGIMIVADLAVADPGTSLPWSRLVWWILPLDDPAGSAWQGGWLTSPLWYLRAMLWVLLAAPVLVAVGRRARTWSLVVPVLAVVVLDVAGRDPSWLPDGLVRLPWLLGDLALYGGFALLGIAHHDGVLDRVTRRTWLELAGLSACAATWWISTQPVEGWVVNNSHPAHLFVGLAWLCLAFAARDLVASLPNRRGVGAVVRVVNQRSLTIYLWHAATIITAYQLLWNTTDDLPTGVFSVVLLAMVAAMTTAAVLAFGWIEDLAGRRRPHLWPSGRTHRAAAPAGATRRRPMPALAFGTVGVAVLATAAVVVSRPDAVLAASAASGTATTTAKRSLPAPSQQPRAVTFQASPATTTPVYTGERSSVYTATAATPVTTDAAATPTATTPIAQVPLAPAASAELAGSLQAALEAWVVQMGIPGASLGVVRPGEVRWTGVAGTDLDGRALGAERTFPIASVTKTFTGALVMREVAKGTIALDEPLPVLDAVPDFPYAGRITVRQLLDHSSGLVNYRSTPEFPQDPSAVVTAVDALRMTGAQPLLFPPGSTHGYSSSNYLALGFLLEQVTGRSYHSLLAELTSEFGLDRTTHEASGAGEPNFSAAGVVSDLDDLLRWGTAELRDEAVFPAGEFADYARVDPASMVGPVWGYCPCTLDADGQPVMRAIGQSGSTTVLAYARADDVVTVIDVPSGLWDTDERAGQVSQFLEEVRAIVDAATGVGRAGPTPA